MKKVYFLLILLCLSCLNWSSIAQTTSYTTVGTYTFTVGTGYSTIAVDMAGGGGGNSLSSQGGKGGRVQAILAVTAGQVLNIYVGGAGSNYVYCTSTAGGANGSGGGANGGFGYGYGGGGGGSSDIRIGGTALSNRVIIAGGGGGGGYNCGTTNGEFGGAGGFPAGGFGTCCNYGTGTAQCYGGSGGTQTAGGVGATCYSANAGGLGVGGNATGAYCYSGGGGGGYYGGGSGAYAGGGGGSSFNNSSLTSSVTHTSGFQSGVGYVNITPLPPTVVSSPSTLAFGPVTTGTTSSSIVFSLTGSNLTTSSVTVTPPANFRISPDGFTWYTNSSPYTISFSGTGFSQIMYAQFQPPSAGAFSANMTVTGGGLASTYNILETGNGAAVCSGTPTAGTASASPTSGNSGTSITLSLSGSSVSGGLSYQWQSSPTGVSGTFTNIAGAITPTYTFTGLTANTWYQCVVTCPTFTTATSTSTAVTFTLPASSCIPTSSSNPCSYYAGTSGAPFTVTGSTGAISDASVCGSGTGGSPYYYNNISQNVTFLPGGSYTATMSTTNCYETGQVWIDFSDNGIFETSESVGGYAYLSSTTACPSARPTAVLSIPTTAAPGAHRMRVVNSYDGNNGPGASVNYPCYPQIPPCPTTTVIYADTRDYTAIIARPAPALTATSVANFGSVTTGTSSAPVLYTAITASNLVPAIGFVTITAPTNFLISPDGITWVSSMPLAYTGGAINGQNVYIQFNPTAATSYSGNITITGGGLASTVNVAVAGAGSAACTGGPTGGTATISTSTGGPANVFTLGLTGASASGGLTYQWQSSPNNTTWTDITGAIVPNYTFVGISANTYFRCVVTCPTGSSANSTSVLATYQNMAASSCTPSFSNACSSYPMSTSIGSWTGASGSSIIDPSNFGANSASCAANYMDQTGTMSITVVPGTAYTATLNVSVPYYIYFSVQCWIDFNDDGTFQTTESIGGIPVGSITSSTPACTFTIPTGAPAGTHRMRMMGNYCGCSTTGCAPCCAATVYPNMNPCPSGVSYGNVRDYKVVIGSGGPAPVGACTGTPNPGIVSPSQTTGCSAYDARLYNVGETIPFTGLTYQWQSSTSPSSGFANISGATGLGYVPPTVSTIGTTYYRQVVTCLTTTVSAATPSIGITLNPQPGPITGVPTFCGGFTSTFTDGTAGGSWTSSAPAVASVGSSTGLVTALTVGTATISYTLPTGCSSVYPITVNPQPASITGGGATLCGGSVPTTATYVDATTGGTWSTSDATKATVNASTGVVTGIGNGSAVISYTLPTGCFSTSPVSVNAVAPITGLTSICIGFTSSLSDATSCGVWSSSNPSVATISSGGLVTSVSVGLTNVSYTSSCLGGCAAYTPVNITNPPSIFSVIGGGTLCAGGTGVSIGLNNSNVGISYQLYNGATAVASAVGTGGAISFGLFTAAGTYGVIANPGTACSATMTGSATVVVNPLPTAFSVTGGGAYCSGGSGVHIFLNSSTIGVNYQLMLGTSPVGAPVAGTSASLDFGLFTNAGTYTVVATNAATGCVNNMSGSVTISINPLPTAFGMTGGGGFCAGATGVAVGLSGSASGTSYQLLLAGVPVGAPVSGSGSPLNFGTFTTGGNYTVLATNTTTGCSALMSGTSVVVVNPLPTVFNVTGGGGYCSGGTGVPVGVNGSTSGVNYQLVLGTTNVGTAVAGTGTAISFGNQTSAGSYSVVATNATTGCVNTMFGSVTVSVNPLPTSYSVTGGGGYCAGGSGLPVGLSGSALGTNYQLFCNGVLVGAGSGTGGPINFGLQLTPGVYTVVGTNSSTSCVGNMSGSVTITINPLPSVFSVTGGGSFCATGAGVAVGLNSSTTGVNYQLYNGAVATGAPVAGTGSAISFGLQTGAGTYTVVAVNTSTLCTINMSGSATIVVNPLPVVYAVTGGGSFCAGGTGVRVGLISSNSGISYQLNNGAPVGSPLSGTGASLDYGLITAAGTYSVVATNPSTGCTVNMSGAAVVGVSVLPTRYNVTGGGNYCAGGTGTPVGMSNSDAGMNYQLFVGGLPIGSAVAGTGSPISFGLQTAPGSYTVVGTDASTGCVNNMLGSVTVGINPLPAVFAVTGGGNYCAGGTGVRVGLSGSAVGISYQLMNGATSVGAALAGTGGALDFGFQTSAGSYTVVATNSTTGCVANMTGSVIVAINPLPGAFAVIGGGNYCIGGTGVHVGLGGSATGINYQLYASGSPVGVPMAGTGLALDFGLQTTAGLYSVIATNTTTSCTNAMTGTATVVVNSLPVLHTVTGGGNYCIGGTGVNIGLDGSNTGTTYQLYNGAVAVGAAVPGSTGSPINFGAQTALGIYTVVANNTSTTCTGNMSGSATVGVNPLPAVYSVTGGGNYCTGGTGVRVGLSGSNTGVQYQLMNGASTVGGPLTGTGSALDFGLQTAAGVYSVAALTISTGCTATMSGSVTIAISPLPVLHNVTGGGNYCAGGTGVHVNLDGTNTGTTYQLMNGAVAVGSPMPGTGSGIDFGLQTAAGTYTIVATTTTTGCVNVMTGSVTINIDPLPNAYTVMGGGNYCSGGTGVDISLSNSDAGVIYQLMNGAGPVGAAISGSGAAIDFGMQTAAGIYSVMATNTTTGCTNTMGSTVTVGINPLPTVFTVGGGGNYCAGGSGVRVTLSNSTSGVSYQLMLGGSPVGLPMSGTGSSLDFGLQTVAGAYTVEATNTATTCTNTMGGSVTIGVNPLPNVYTVASSGSNYCAGGSGIDIWVNNSDAGINYQLLLGTTSMGAAMPGTGSMVDFGNQLPAGAYHVVATNAVTGCTSNMTGTVAVIVNPLPATYTVTGGGAYCNGGSGVHIGLSGSGAGVSYQLKLGAANDGAPIIGGSGAIDFGLRTSAGTYTVVATDPATTCTKNMGGSATVAVNAIPSTFTVTGGGNYCAGGAGVHVGLSGSTSGVNYQLYRGGATLAGSPIAGTGLSLDFGTILIPGIYTVVATDATAGCTRTMTGSQTVGTTPAPVAYTVIGGGNFCPGGGGVHVGISGSTAGVSYQLYRGTVAVGLPVSGSGSAVDFGSQTIAGTYTVVGTNNTTGCTNNMVGSATVILNTLPIAYNVIGGGNYCAGGAGVHVGLSNSTLGINYTLYRGFTLVSSIPGTGGPLDFGLQTGAGTYTVLATNSTTSCQTTMTGSVTVVVNPVVSPVVTLTTGVGDTVCEGTNVTFTALTTNGGTAPAYQWTVNGAIASLGSTYSYAPANGDIVGVTMTSSAVCATPAVVGSSVTMTVDPNLMPTVGVSANPGTVVCAGTPVVFSASIIGGGTTPGFTWMKNGTTAGTSSTYSYIPSNGDVVYCILNSNYHCRLANSASSSHITMEVDVLTTPSVVVNVFPGSNIAAGQSATFTATVSNAGPLPTYQWLVNSVPVPGATLPTFVTSNLVNNDSVTCQVLSSGGCAGILGAGSTTVHVYGTGVQQIAGNGSDIKLMPNPSKGDFTVKGSLGSMTNEDVTAEVTNMLGQVIYKSVIQSHNGEINEHINLGNNLANGMYMLSLKSESGSKVFHLVIEQ